MRNFNEFRLLPNRSYGELFNQRKFQRFVQGMKVVRNIDEWDGYVDQCGSRDFYYRGWYYELEAKRVRGEAVLLVNEGGVVFPVIVKDGKGFGGYGYGGPLGSAEVQRGTYRERLRECIKELGLGSLEVALHPVYMDWQRGVLGGVELKGKTVVVDLALSKADRVNRYERGHRARIRQGLEAGFEFFEDSSDQGIEWFIDIYNETMGYLEAKERYFFEEQYLRVLVENGLRIFHVKDAGGKVISSGMFSFEGDVVGFHLSGTCKEAREMSPSKILLDGVMDAGSAQGMRLMHLGGGVGAQEDSLYAFKKGFGGDDLEFGVFREELL